MRERDRRKWHTELTAFTLTELLAVMVIMGVVITTGYTVWILMLKQQADYEEKVRGRNELARFETQLRIDIDQSNTITVCGNKILCHSPIRRVDYDFFDDMTIRRSNVNSSLYYHREKPDTFLIAAVLPLLVGEVMPDGAKRMDVIRVEIGFQEIPYKIMVCKELCFTDR